VVVGGASRGGKRGQMAESGCERGEAQAADGSTARRANEVLCYCVALTELRIKSTLMRSKWFSLQCTPIKLTHNAAR